MIANALVDWSRAQFALTAGYHWIFVPLTLGLAVIMASMETLYVIKKDEFWKNTAKFWMKLFAINFAVGIATGCCIHELATRIQMAEMPAPMPVIHVANRCVRLLTLFHPKNMMAKNVASMKNARMPSIASGAPKMSPTNHE